MFQKKVLFTNFEKNVVILENHLFVVSLSLTYSSPMIKSWREEGVGTPCTTLG
jgi:hypothetical protein